MKKSLNTGLTFLMLFVLFVIDVSAESIEKYYANMKNLTGESLKKELHKKISNHTMLPYFKDDKNPVGVGEMMKFTDQDPNNSENIILIYTGRSQDYDFTDHGNRVDYAKEFNSVHENAWNREHIWPKSHGFPTMTDTAYTDIHHLRPADRSVNGDRGARDMDWGGLPNKEAIGAFSDFDSWEPRDEIKGDIARMLFYVAVRYEEDGNYDLEIVDETNTHGPRIGKLSTLLEWNELDPVSESERRRNQIIYEKYQNNRNPFIDHPEYAEKIWGKPQKTPTLNKYLPYLSFGDIHEGKKSETQTYVIQGYNLKSKVKVVIPEGFYALNSKGKKLKNKFSLNPNKGKVNEIIKIGFAPNKKKLFKSNLVLKSGKQKIMIPLKGRGVDSKTEIVISEDFERKDTDWLMIDKAGSRNWQIGSYGDNHFAKIKGYKSDKPCEDWLISPKVPTAYDNPTLFFESAMNYNDDIVGLELYFTKNYTGDPSTTKWTMLDPVISKGHWNWIDSGYLSLDMENAKDFRLGFVFKTTDPKKGRSWEVDNIKVTGVPKK